MHFNIYLPALPSTTKSVQSEAPEIPIPTGWGRVRRVKAKKSARGVGFKWDGAVRVAFSLRPQGEAMGLSMLAEDSKKPPAILIIDDDEQVRNLLAEILSDGNDCMVAGSAEEALALLGTESF